MRSWKGGTDGKVSRLIDVLMSSRMRKVGGRLRGKFTVQWLYSTAPHEDMQSYVILIIRISLGYIYIHTERYSGSSTRE